MTYQLKPRMAGAGFWMMGTAAADLGARKLVYLDSNGKWDLADEDSLSNLPVLGITRHAILSGKKGEVLIWGIIGDSSWTWTVGNAIYVSSTAGELTQTKPSAAEYPHLQSIALPIDSTLILFNPAFKADVLNDVVMMNDNNWEDLRFPISGIRLGGASPATVVAYKGGLVLQFADNVDQFAYLTAQIPHRWVSESTIVPHIHWNIKVNGSGTGVENVKFDITHSWANIESNYPGESTLSFTRDVQLLTADTHLLDTWVGISGTGKTFSSMLIISIKRDTGVANNYADDVYLTEFDIHYRSDRLGSYGETPS